MNKNLKSLVKDATYAEFLSAILDKDPNAGHLYQEIDNMNSSKNKSSWASNHPLVQLSHLMSDKNPKMDLAVLSPKIKDLMVKMLNPVNGKTKMLIDKLCLNPDFVRLFVVNPTLQTASLESIKSYDDSILQGGSGMSQSHGE